MLTGFSTGRSTHGDCSTIMPSSPFICGVRRFLTESHANQTLHLHYGGDEGGEAKHRKSASVTKQQCACRQSLSFVFVQSRGSNVMPGAAHRDFEGQGHESRHNARIQGDSGASGGW